MFTLTFELGLPRAHKLEKFSESQSHILLYDNFLLTYWIVLDAKI